jgi:hypothetical protein
MRNSAFCFSRQISSEHCEMPMTYLGCFSAQDISAMLNIKQQATEIIGVISFLIIVV